MLTYRLALKIQACASLGRLGHLDTRELKKKAVFGGIWRTKPIVSTSGSYVGIYKWVTEIQHQGHKNKNKNNSMTLMAFLLGFATYELQPSSPNSLFALQQSGSFRTCQEWRYGMC